MTPFLSACTVIGHDSVMGWPELEVTENYVSHREMRDRCAPYTPPLMSPEACAEFDFALKRCTIWFSVDFPPPARIVAHERLHCAGHDHVGESTLRGAWRANPNNARARRK